MKVAITRTTRFSTPMAQLACAFAIVLVVAVLMFVRVASLAPAHTAAPAIRSAVPTSAPANYHLPSEPVDYNDPNYIGSYGG